MQIFWFIVELAYAFTIGAAVLAVCLLAAIGCSFVMAAIKWATTR